MDGFIIIIFKYVLDRIYKFIGLKEKMILTILLILSKDKVKIRIQFLNPYL